MLEHGRYPWIPPEIGRPDGRNHTGEGSGVSRGRGRSTSKLAGDQGGGEMTRSTARRGARARLGSVWPLVDVTVHYRTLARDIRISQNSPESPDTAHHP